MRESCICIYWQLATYSLLPHRLAFDRLAVGVDDLDFVDAVVFVVAVGLSHGGQRFTFWE